MSAERREALLSLVPCRAHQAVEWERLAILGLAPLFSEMAATRQNPLYHAEGDVMTHTRLVVEELVASEEYLSASFKERAVLFLGALFHDAGKIKATKEVEGVLVSPYHTQKSAYITREMLWREFDLAGTREYQELREAIVFLVRYHSFPPYAIKAEDGERRALRIAANGELTPLFNMKMLYLLARADAKGRRGDGAEDMWERVELFRLMMSELACLDAPYSFASPYSERAYFREKTAHPAQELYCDTWGEILMMSGLPGTGKDTWLSQNAPDLPMVSLDEWRKKLHISPRDPQAPVVAAAQEEAREYLRRKQPFVWNATGLSKQIRWKQIELFEQYNAGVRILFLETDWETERLRNEARREEAVVPAPTIEKMLRHLEVPERYESERVEWKTV